MKTNNGGDKKPNKVKELYDQMQAEKKKASIQKHRPGKKNRGYNGGGKFNSQPRNAVKKNWHR